jgi:hypothetical protein
MTFVEQRTISRKTPIDAMLEISAEAAQRLATLGAYFTVISSVIIDGLEGSARLRSMSCTCEKGAGSAHEHQFIEAELLRLHEPGTEVRIAIDDARPRTLRIDRA